MLKDKIMVKYKILNIKKIEPRGAHQPVFLLSGKNWYTFISGNFPGDFSFLYKILTQTHTVVI